MPMSSSYTLSMPTLPICDHAQCRVRQKLINVTPDPPTSTTLRATLQQPRANPLQFATRHDAKESKRGVRGVRNLWTRVPQSRLAEIAGDGQSASGSQSEKSKREIEAVIEAPNLIVALESS